MVKPTFHEHAEFAGRLNAFLNYIGIPRFFTYNENDNLSVEVNSNTHTHTHTYSQFC